MRTALSELRVIPKEQLTAWERWEMAALAEARAEEEAAARARADAALAGAAAHGTGFQQGLEEGRKAGHAEGFAQGLAEARQQATQLARLSESAQQVLGSVQGAVSEGVVELALAIARQVIGSELAARPESIIEVVRAALGQAGGAQAGLHLRLHPADAVLVRTHMAEEIGRGNWTLVEDPAMAPGGCHLADANGDIDASLPVRWQRVLAALGRKEPLVEAQGGPGIHGGQA